MGKISQKKREGYCKIAGQLCENPFMHRDKLAKNAKLSRNTVSEYLKSMYAGNFLIESAYRGLLQQLRSVLYPE